MRKLLVASGFVLLTHLGIAHAAGPFDVAWSGEAVGTGGSKACNAVVTGTVTNNVLHGVMKWGKFTPTDFGGAIAPDGSFKSPAGKITGKFEGSSFIGSFSVPNGYCNPYKLTMNRL